MANRKKQISKTEKKLRGKVKYLRSKNKKVLNEIELLNKKDENKFIKFEGKKRKVSTVKNILKNKITKNNTSYSKAINQLQNRFGYKVRNYVKKIKSNQKGITKSPYFSAWQTKDAKDWINNKNKLGVLNDILIDIYQKIDEVTTVNFMDSNDSFYITIDYNNLSFSVDIDKEK
ncbi:hypothetical protein [Flavobacterium sp.]|uniref:hypothetical protein n=1 Tax=Flavobacterium sp. TaxID=239 RepID=UPI00391BD470